jgi:hypothetical protein
MSGFLYEMNSPPPLIISTAVQTLLRLAESTDRLFVIFSDEEKKSYAVELAACLRGYVLSKDSDFVVLHADGYQGYIPLDEVMWTNDAPLADDDVGADAPVDPDGFTVIQKARRRPLKRETQSGRSLIPPCPSGSTPVLSLNIYSPLALAAHLKLPVGLLPLLGAFIGNNVTSPERMSPQSLPAFLFERQSTHVQRIERTANALNSALAKPTSSATTLIERTVQALLRSRNRNGVGSGEVADMIEKIAEAALQYAIPPGSHGDNGATQNGLEPLVSWPEVVCVVHSPATCSIMRLFRLPAPPTVDSCSSEDPRVLYMHAYRTGLLASRITDVLHTRTAWPQIFLEDPDLETVARSVGRKLREWIYAILDAGVGLGKEEHGEDQEESTKEGADEADGAVARATINAHGVELERIHVANSPMATVTEYLRRGTRVATEVVPIPSLVDLLTSIGMQDYYQQYADKRLPIQLWPESDRLTVFLRMLGSDLPRVRALDPHEMTGVLALRWVVHTMHVRVGEMVITETQVKARAKERWTAHEARAFLDSFSWQTTSAREIVGEEETETTLPSISNRNVQLCAQVFMALESIEWLAQVLLLFPQCVASPVHLYSGQNFHARLSSFLEPNSYADKLWEATVEGLRHAFRDEVTSPQRKEGKAKSKGPGGAKRGTPSGSRIGLFELLADNEAS